MRITRKFTQEGVSPYADIEFRKLSSVIKNPDGSVVFAMNDIDMPASWSQVASDVLAQKYFRKAGVPARLKKKFEPGLPEWLCPSVPDEEGLNQLPESAQFAREATSQQVFHRLAGCWTYWGWKHGYFDSEKDAENYCHSPTLSDKHCLCITQLPF